MQKPVAQQPAQRDAVFVEHDQPRLAAPLEQLYGCGHRHPRRHGRGFRLDMPPGRLDVRDVRRQPVSLDCADEPFAVGQQHRSHVLKTASSTEIVRLPWSFASTRRIVGAAREPVH